MERADRGISGIQIGAWALLLTLLLPSSAVRAAEGAPVVESGLSPKLSAPFSVDPPAPPPAPPSSPPPAPRASLPSPPPAPRETESSELDLDDRLGLQTRHFEISQLVVLQSDGNSFSPEASWCPRWRITERLALRLGLGTTLLKGFQRNIFAFGYQGFLSWGPRSAQLDLGVGGQTWFGQGTSILYTLQTNLMFPSRVLGLFSRFFVAYSLYPVPRRITHELQAGLGVDF